MTGRRYYLNGGAHGLSALDVTDHGCALWDEVQPRTWTVRYPVALTRGEAGETLREARGAGFNVERELLEARDVMNVMQVHKDAERAVGGEG